jgi:hypothetical protein
LATRLNLSNTKNMLKIVLFLQSCWGILRFGGTPKKFHGTLVTPVEKHCIRPLKKANIDFLKR